MVVYNHHFWCRRLPGNYKGSQAGHSTESPQLALLSTRDLPDAFLAMIAPEERTTFVSVTCRQSS